LNRERKGL